MIARNLCTLVRSTIPWPRAFLPDHVVRHAHIILSFPLPPTRAFLMYRGKGMYFYQAPHREHEVEGRAGTSYEESLLPGATSEGGGAVTGAGVPLRRDLTFAPEGMED